MTYSSRLVGGPLQGRLVAFIPSALAVSALGTGGCSIDFSAACTPGRACDDARTARKGAVGEIAPSATGGAAGSVNAGPPPSGVAGAPAVNGSAAGGFATTRWDGASAAPSTDVGGAAGSTADGAGGDPGTPPVGGRSGACASGFQDCNGDPADGCEVDTRTNTEHCGACGNACSADGVRARFCVAGTCAPTCLDFLGDCSSVANDGCETSLAHSANCGGCGHDCGKGACLADGQCGAVDIASNVRGVSRVAVTTDTVYWEELSEDDTKTTLHGTWRNDGRSSVRSFDTTRRLTDFTAVGDELYITFAATGSEPLDGAVARWNQGDPPEDIVTGIAPAFVAATSKHVYWTDIVDKNVHRAGRGGEDPTRETIDGDLPFELVASGDYVYAATTGGRMFGMNESGWGRVLGAAPPAQSLFVAADRAWVFAWTSDGRTAGLGRYDAVLPANPSIILTEPDTSSLGRGLAAAGGEVFFAREDGIYRVPEDPGAGAPRQLVDTTGPVLQIVIREHTLYWVELAPDRQTGSVRSVNFY